VVNAMSQRGQRHQKYQRQRKDKNVCSGTSQRVAPTEKGKRPFYGVREGAFT
jgi:hypothetical protein